MYYLLKTEPSEYSFADLERDHETIWDGVSNPVALRNLREMPASARLVIYHTGDDPRVRIKAEKPLARPVTLAEIKANKAFADSPLVRQGRLSVVPLSEAQYRFLVGR
jgi:predicted RNA-binding protein with PUA-like domain